MADVNIDMLLSDSTRSIGRRRREVQALNQELERTRGLMASQASGGGGGDGPEIERYNRARGAVGTGAAGRDFANQAQGLGGVVRLYATFAANIFAVGAAFQNLQQAANFERLINASKMMSERTGTDLVGLGKRLQEATGYAISFEDAMQFANLGTSAGIAAKQMESLVSIAKGAAAGLGRDVNDAVRRIIQGTAKQEQEILDELGIFIKAKKAYDDYAKKFQIEGGADALSAQQRVAAYADAVEQAGSKWKDFAKLDDPFSRFVATGKEALNEILNFINQGIKPLLSFLADSKGAVIALALAISGMLAKRALPELKNLAIDLFTFSSARTKAQAEQQRVEIARRMAEITNTIQAEQAKLAAIAGQTQALTMQAVTATLPPGMLARTGASGQAVGAGIAPKKLEQAIFGRPGSPVDLASYTKLEDLEKKYRDAVQQTVKTSQVKLDQMIQLGVLQNTSTLNELKLSDAIKRSSAEMFAKIQQYNAGLLTRIELEQAIVKLQQEQAGLSARIAATTPGQIQAIPRAYGQRAPDFVGPVQPNIAQRAAASAGVVGSVATSMWSATSQQISGFTQALGQVSQSTQRYSDVINAPFLTRLRSFGNIFLDNIAILRNSATAMERLGAVTGIAGQLIGGAFRGIMAAFGPVMILWTMWELFGKKLLPDSWKAASELQTKIEDLAKALEVTGSALNRLNNAFEKGIDSSKEYGNYLQIFSNSLKSQIDSYKKLLEEKEKAENVDLIEKAAKAYAERGEIFNKDIYNIDQLIAASQRLGVAQTEEVQELKKLKKEYQDLEKAKGAVNYGKSGLFMLGFRTQAEKEIEQRELALTRRSLQARENLTPATERRIAVTSEVTRATEDADKVIDALDKKLKGISDLGDIAATETSQAIAKAFKSYNKALEQGIESGDQTLLAKTSEEMIGRFEKLAPYSQAAAQGLLAIGAAAEAAALSGQKLSSSDIIKILQTFQERVIKEVNEKTKKYTDKASKGFVDAQKAIDDYTASIMKLEMELAKTSNMNKLLQDMRGFSSEAEIAAERSTQVAKANQEYAKELKQIELELAKVTNVQKSAQGAGYKDELDAANQKAKAARTEAALRRDSKILTADTTAKNNELNSVLQQINLKYEEIGRRLNVQLAKTAAALKIEQTRFNILKELGAYSPTGAAAQEEVLQRQEINNQYDRALKQSEKLKNQEFERLEEQFKAAGRTEAAVGALVVGENKALGIQKEANENAKIERDTALEVLRITTLKNTAMAKLAEETEKLNRAEALKDVKYDTELQLLNIRKEELSIALGLGKITQDVYDKESTALERSIRQKEHINKLDKINFEFKQQEASINARAAAAIQLQSPYGPVDTSRFDQELAAAIALRDAKLKGAELVYEKNETLRKQMESMSTEQRGLAEIYKNTFASMGDAIVEFVRTGKLSFKSLIADMLASIAKLYMNRLFMSLFSSIFPSLPGLGAGPGTITTGSGLSVPGVAGASAPSSIYSLAPPGKALGAAYDRGGIEYYAKGGMFTNSIVDSPTLFKFAKGTGLMGEAGPEAIMPLKRDSQGNLGVRAGGGGNVEVVVNNYSTAQAETRESTDSRGNRRIEVVIGDMTAGEITRNGSSTQRAMGGTFGLQPQLIRR